MALAHSLIIKWMKVSLIGLKDIHLKDIQISRISILHPADYHTVINSIPQISDKGSTPAEYPDITIAPSFDLDEPNEPATP